MKNLARALGLTVLCAAAVTQSAALAQSSAPAKAQPAAQQGGGFGFSSTGGPIDITADRSESFQPQRRSVWEGNVIAVQGTDKLQTPHLEVFFAESGAHPAQATSGAGPDMGRIERMEAEGPVYFVTPTQQAKGDHATYEATSDTITLIGNVILLQDKNVVKGEKLVIEQKSGHSTLYASPKVDKGRVRGVFYPSSQTSPSNQPAASAKPGASPPKKP